MLKEIANIWQGKTLMRDVLAELVDMISDGQYVFTHAWKMCGGEAAPEDLKEKVLDRDKSINRGERKIRRMLVEHLTLNPGHDVSGCLAMMVMAKDAERIGDLAKDLLRLGTEARGRIRELDPHPRIFEVVDGLSQSFSVLQEAIRQSDPDVTDRLFTNYKKVKAWCRELSDDAVREGRTAETSALNALLVQTLSRINAHIGNVASGIVFPIENIDFVSRGLKRRD